MLICRAVFPRGVGFAFHQESVALHAHGDKDEREAATGKDGSTQDGPILLCFSLHLQVRFAAPGPAAHTLLSGRASCIGLGLGPREPGLRGKALESLFVDDLRMPGLLQHPVARPVRLGCARCTYRVCFLAGPPTDQPRARARALINLALLRLHEQRMTMGWH